MSALNIADEGEIAQGFLRRQHIDRPGRKASLRVAYHPESAGGGERS